MLHRSARRIALAAALAAVFACASEEDREAVRSADASEELVARSVRIARDTLIVDTHVDLPYRLYERGELDLDVSRRTDGGHFDAARARDGGLDAPFMSIYVPAELEGDGAKDRADRLVDLVEAIVERSPDVFAVARSPDEVRSIAASGRIALPMGMENGAPIDGDLANLRHFHARGIRYITLTHASNNHLSDSSYETEPRWGGLSPFGREVVAEMNRLGVMIDVSHLSDAAFDDVLEVSRAPVIASHSSCRAFTPGFERNLDDARIRRLGEAGGVFQVNFGSAFLTQEANRWSSAMWTAVGTWLEEHALTWSSPEAEERRREFMRAHSPPPTSVSDVADHIDHAVVLAGIDHVGIGSDFDGVTLLPEGLSDVSMYPRLVEELLRRRYGEADIRKILGGNILRVWAEVERHAEAS